MSLKSEPLLVFNGMDATPQHGSYASALQDGAQPASITEGVQRRVVITFDDANRHLITLGATGSRKTTSVMAPALLRLIELWCAGLIVDVKGEYRHLADWFPNRVVVLGADDSAIPFNLIAGMSDAQFRAFLEEIRPKSREPFWGSLGLQDARFVRETYRLMGAEPTLAQIAEALSAPKSFVQEFDAFIQWSDHLPADYHQLLQAVLSNTFSVLAMGESTLLGLDAPGKEDVQKQYTWQTAGLISVLAPFSDNACLKAKFSPKPSPADDESSESKSALSMESLLYRDRKVLLLDLPVDRFGNTAHVISKLLRIRMIATITGFRRHQEIGCGDTFYTFFAADEYQHLINIDQQSASAGLYDDTTFFDRCRSYGHINLVAAQSVSALRGKVPTTEREESLDCLLQNIGTAITFSSSDAATDRLLRGRVSAADGDYISSVVRSDLAAGQAFVIGRNLNRHKNSTLVARVQAGPVTGAPHMSRYFAGMPAPQRIPAFNPKAELLKNPYCQVDALPPTAGAAALQRSYRWKSDNTLVEVEMAQGTEDVCDYLIMEDRDIQVHLRGLLTGPKPSIWQPGLNLEIVAQSQEWRMVLPMAVVMPKVLEFMPVNGKHREWQPLPGCGARCLAQPVTIKTVTEPGDEWGEKGMFTEFQMENGGSIRLPQGSWKAICRCLGRLESEYREITFGDYTFQMDDDPFDVFIEDLFEEDSDQDSDSEHASC